MLPMLKLSFNARYEKYADARLLTGMVLPIYLR